MRGTPTLAEVLNRALAAQAADLHVSIPAVVRRVDLAKGLIDAQPLVKERLDVGEAEEAVSVEVIANVPIVWPGAGGMRITFPLAVGDTVLLVFSDRSLDLWLEKGGEVDPADGRRHALSDAIALPGLRSFKDAWAGADASDMTIGAQGGPFQPAGLGTALRTELDAIWTKLVALGTHTHPVAGVQTGSSSIVSSTPSSGAITAAKQTVESGTVKVSQ